MGIFCPLTDLIKIKIKTFFQIFYKLSTFIHENAILITVNIDKIKEGFFRVKFLVFFSSINVNKEKENVFSVTREDYFLK